MSTGKIRLSVPNSYGYINVKRILTRSQKKKENASKMAMIKNTLYKNKFSILDNADASIQGDVS